MIKNGHEILRFLFHMIIFFSLSLLDLVHVKSVKGVVESNLQLVWVKSWSDYPPMFGPFLSFQAANSHSNLLYNRIYGWLLKMT